MDGFNSATAVRCRGKQPRCGRLRQMLIMRLQFGHGGDAVENPLETPRRAFGQSAASIRPRRFDAVENRAIPACGRGLAVRLQFGHGGSMPWKTNIAE